ncbi:PspC domain-containing protein [Tuanshanicoccus lijuaniae]|uniref:PspC domain-containing protein n=1 Tax=Aerococcaceae bacterium zg-1292 TaxID=2774330 RepID=UPI001BD88EB2|nr:PspC domain-containing protein [Aerococcaceae bacterium zg-BR22]MBS4456781.1 PspC domain-containing protein [Aerococcaceae bacterium zg-A91]MBS4458573.1 PspC domain-containing protein [Aerococcaceae bacterium zg-BR33]
MKKLRLSRQKYILGVCGGIAEYFEINPVLVRLMFVLFAIYRGAGLGLYLIMWAVIKWSNSNA